VEQEKQAGHLFFFVSTAIGTNDKKERGPSSSLCLISLLRIDTGEPFGKCYKHLSYGIMIVWHENRDGVLSMMIRRYGSMAVGWHHRQINNKHVWLYFSHGAMFVTCQSHHPSAQATFFIQIQYKGSSPS
jgi:hypothetical protein